ncbi:MAG: SPFH domain-containing protein [Gammaproteobacteria bacterium]
MKISKIIALLVLIALLYAASYIVPEGRVGVILPMDIRNQSKEVRILQPGLRFALPWLEQIKLVDLRLQTTAFRLDLVQTADKAKFSLDYYIDWSISDVNQYLQQIKSTNSINTFPLQLRAQIETEMKKVLSNVSGVSLAADQKQLLSGVLTGDLGKKISAMGITVATLGITNIHYLGTERNVLLQQSKEKYEDLATEYQTVDEVSVQKLQKEVDEDAKNIVAKAEAEARKIRSEADAEVMEMYNDAYKQSPGFYLWYKQLETYKQVFLHGGNVLILQSGGALLQNLPEKHKR